MENIYIYIYFHSFFSSFSVCLSSLTLVIVCELAAPLAFDIKLRHLSARPISCQSFSTPSALHKHLQFIYLYTYKIKICISYKMHCITLMNVYVFFLSLMCVHLGVNCCVFIYSVCVGVCLVTDDVHRCYAQ